MDRGKEFVIPDWAPTLGLREAATILGMGKDRLYKLLEDNAVNEADKPPFYRREGGHYRFNEGELRRYLLRFAHGNRD